MDIELKVGIILVYLILWLVFLVRVVRHKKIRKSICKHKWKRVSSLYVKCEQCEEDAVYMGNAPFDGINYSAGGD